MCTCYFDDLFLLHEYSYVTLLAFIVHCPIHIHVDLRRRQLLPITTRRGVGLRTVMTLTPSSVLTMGRRERIKPSAARVNTVRL